MNTEALVKNIISKHKGAIRKQQIARELKMSLDYVDLICRDLARKGEIIFSGRLCSIPKSSKKVPFTIHQSVKQTSFSLSDIPKLTADVIDVLKREGYATVESLADVPLAKLMQAAKLEVHEAARLINHARKVLGKIKDNEAAEEEGTP